MAPNASFDVEYILNGFTAMLVIALGLIGNMLTVIVLTRRTMHSSTNCYLTALAVWDTMVLLGTLFLMTLAQLSLSYEEQILPYVAVYIYPLALVAQTVTVWLTVSFTVERYIAVCFPLKAASMCTVARARIVITSVSLGSVLYNACRWFEYEITYVNDNNNTNSTKLAFQETAHGNNFVYRRVYLAYMYPFIMFLIPLLSLAILNTCLIMAVKQSQKQRRDMNVRQSRENNVTIMLVIVVIVFMLCQFPALIYNVAFAINQTKLRDSYGWEVLSAIRNFMVTLNSAVNFMLYCAFGQKFRRIFMRTFCSFLLKNENFNSITYHGTILATTTDGTKYTKMVRNRKGTQCELIDLSSSNAATHSTLLSKCSPHSSKNSSPRQKLVWQKYENGKFHQQPNEIKDLFISDCEEDNETTKMVKRDLPSMV